MGRLLALLIVAFPLVPLASASGSVADQAQVGAYAAATAAVAPKGSGPLHTSVFDPFLQDAPDAELARGFSHIAGAGAHFVLLDVPWRSVAPRGDVKPAGFDASNPADPKYRWRELDAQVQLALAKGLEPVLQVWRAPDWAAGVGTLGGRDYKPSPSEYGQFGTALARRYSGTFLTLPRVRYWGAWNEPNLPFYLEPQTNADGSPFSPGWYRDMVNAFADAVHGVDASNVVIAGNTAPFTSRTGAADRWGLAPLVFMRNLLCLQPTCNDTIRFDVWAHHPYTSGGPMHHASRPDDVSLGDLGEMRQVLVAGARSGHVISSRAVQFWATEFSWDTNPPDPGGLKPDLQARWTSEALYRAWRAGVSTVTWFLLTDQPMTKYFAQSGLYYRDGLSATGIVGRKAKPTLAGFRFPFVAYTTTSGTRSNRAAAYPRSGTKILVWGRTPENKRARVVIEQSRNKLWRPIAVVTTNQYGIFGRKLWTPTKGPVRARSLTKPATSRAFYLTRPRDRFVSPFGQGWTD